MITPTARRILERFAESYPHSAHYRGGRKLRKAGWHLLLPRIAEEVEAKHRFLDAVDELVRAGIISVKWRRYREGDEVEALYLEQPGELYRLLGRRSPVEAQAALRSALAEAREATEARHSLARTVAGYLGALLEASHPVPFADETELRDALRLLSLTSEEAGSLPLRALSVRLFSDSKRIEALIRSIDAATRSAAGVRASEVLGLNRSYPEATIALHGALVFAGGREWLLSGETVSLPQATLDNLTAIRFDGPLLSVENKESFGVHARRLRRGAVLYSGGHPNRAVQALLALAAAAAGDVLHSGDMDPEGLLIYQEIAASVPRLRPHLMGPDIYRRYLRFGRPLTERELALLGRVTREELSALVGEMQAHRRAVEQEVVDPAG